VVAEVLAHMVEVVGLVGRLQDNISLGDMDREVGDVGSLVVGMLVVGTYFQGVDGRNVGVMDNAIGDSKLWSADTSTLR
jgi:hypothetical protein